MKQKKSDLSLIVKIDKEEIYKETGLDFSSSKDYINYLKDMVDFLESHNKNYNKEQYNAILDIKGIIHNIKNELDINIQ